MLKNFADIVRGLGRFVSMALFILGTSVGVVRAGSGPSDERFSPRGIKGAFTIGGIDPSSTQHLESGSYSSLRIGYGIDDRITFWLAGTGSEHTREKDSQGRGIKADVGAFEISMQYAFLTGTRLQPYGRFGFGAYTMENRSSHDAWLGSGVTFGLGADYFVSRHWGIGAEATYRGADYTQARVGKKGDFRELPDAIDGDAAGFALSVTLQ